MKKSQTKKAAGGTQWSALFDDIFGLKAWHDKKGRRDKKRIPWQWALWGALLFFMLGFLIPTDSAWILLVAIAAAVIIYFARSTEAVEEQVLLLLNKVILCPTIIQMPDQSQVVNPPIADKETKLKDVLSELPAKYALSERLVCGECGTLYRRCTWTSRGQKRIVWRCVNRLDHGTKYCKTSPTIPEEPLQEAILKALNTAMSGKDLLSNLHCMYKPADSVFLPGSKIRCGSCKNHSCFLQLLRSKTILPKLLNHLFSLIFQPGNFFCYRSKSLG